MLQADRFTNFRPGKDRYALIESEIKTEDLKPAFKGKPKLSFMISTYNRKGQLARSLECLARQTWRSFEVLVMDDGSTEDLNPLFDTFSKHLQLRTFRVGRGSWRSCPSRAFKFMLEEAKGKVIAISHPEMMLDKRAIKYLYEGCTKKLKDVYYWTIDDPEHTEGDWYWVTLKPNFIHKDMYGMIDTVDWHSDIHNIQKLNNFEDTQGFANKTNSWHSNKKDYPWWFVASAKRECPIWDKMPVFDGHATLDLWLLNYRRIKKVVDVIPKNVMCYHQPHQTSAVAPLGEQSRDKEGI